MSVRGNSTTGFTIYCDFRNEDERCVNARVYPPGLDIQGADIEVSPQELPPLKPGAPKDLCARHSMS